MAKRKKLPTVVVDEHVHPSVKTSFIDAGLRTISASKDRRYKARDERDYLDDLYAANEVFVTGDGEFVSELIEHGVTRHAGIVFVPPRWNSEEQALWAWLAAGMINGRARESYLGMRGVVLVPDGNDGMHVLDGKDEYVCSLAAATAVG